MVDEPKVVNVVGSITYQQELELSALAEDLSEHDAVSETKYEPAENHWLQLRLKYDNTYIAIYRGGKCSVVGCESVENFYEISEVVNNIVGGLLEIDYEPKTEISNIVATADIELSVPLDALMIALGMEKSEYEPEQFPGLIYRPHEFDCVILVFASGKTVITGLKSQELAQEVVAHLTEIINQFEL